jgi:hypothetical protein
MPAWVLAVGCLLGQRRADTRWTLLALRALVPYSVLAIVLPMVVFGGFPPDFSNPLADFVAPLLGAGCLSPNAGEALGLGPAWGGMPFGLGLLVLLGWLATTGDGKAWQKLVCAAVSLALVVLAMTWTGPESQAEQRTLDWVQTDILRCGPVSP